MICTGSMVQCVVVAYRTPQNETHLLNAIRHRLEDVADRLCEMGVDLSMADTQGNSPLWVALRSRQETIATKLVGSYVSRK